MNIERAKWLFLPLGMVIGFTEHLYLDEQPQATPVVVDNTEEIHVQEAVVGSSSVLTGGIYHL